MTTNLTMHSPYMRWAKSNFHVQYNLANSGLMSYKLSQLPVRISDLELTGIHHYGYGPLLAEIEKKYSIPQENIFTTLGTSFANFMTLSVMFEPGAEILIEHPTYELIISAAEHVGYKIKRFYRRFEDGFQIDIDSLKKEVTSNTKLIALTNLHNPSSVYTDDMTLKEIGKIAKSVGAYVCVDEVYLDSAFDLAPCSSFHLDDNFIVTNSLTKVYGLSGIRSGFVFADKELIKKMWLLNDLFYVKHVYAAEQLAVIAFKNLETISKWSKDILSKNHVILNSFMKRNNELEAVIPGFGTTIFLKSKNLNADRLSEVLMKDYDTAVTPGRFFDMPQFIRLGLGCEPNDFAEGITRLEKGLNQITK
ncbi:MAG: aminotransferase class I/II-fold pyridoxal phosphate-dependent enzyme [Ignavibacteriales bacterium]|nr:aminotransferase class I/II-fold pyridoxal phosphate-dependent enzyme [Ignavibacteriales bacterium]